MNDHPMVMALHAAISRRSWHEVEQAANKIRDNRNIRWPFECAGRKQSLPEPGECNWPDCGCDPHATKVIESLVEQGWTGPARPNAGGGVRVKPLEWHKSSLNPWRDDWHTIAPLTYTIRCADEYGWKWAFNGGFGYERSPESAKAAAQADYERRVLSALSNPSEAAESNASVEARLREALEACVDRLVMVAERRMPNSNGFIPQVDAAIAFARSALSTGDGAKKSGGLAPHSQPVATDQLAVENTANGPSDPTADRREIVGRALMEKWPGDYAWGDETREPNELAFETADAILAALDGGAGE